MTQDPFLVMVLHLLLHFLYHLKLPSVVNLILPLNPFPCHWSHFVLYNRLQSAVLCNTQS